MFREEAELHVAIVWRMEAGQGSEIMQQIERVYWVLYLAGVRMVEKKPFIELQRSDQQSTQCFGIRGEAAWWCIAGRSFCVL